MTNKKLLLKRLIIFVFLAYAISWIPAIILNKTIGYDNWFTKNTAAVPALLVGYGPALANVLTRLITKEGFGDCKLHLNIRNGNIKYYVIAFLAPIVVLSLEGCVETLCFGDGNWSHFGESVGGASNILPLLLINVSTAPLMAFNTFGEEFGWRVYMNQKMEPLVGTTGTVVIGGIIWGLWHAELTVEGHNFGTDYPGYPYMGFLAMCILCTFMGMALMWTVKKTNSVYPAAILHASNNFLGGVFSSIFSSGVPEDRDFEIGRYLISSIPAMVIYSVFFVLMLRDNKKKKAASK